MHRTKAVRTYKEAGLDNAERQFASQSRHVPDRSVTSRSPAHDAPDPRLEEVRHLGLPEAVLVPVAPHVADVVGDAASTTV